MDEQHGGGELPGANNVRRIGELELVGAIFGNRNGAVMDGGEQVESAASLKVTSSS